MKRITTLLLAAVLLLSLAGCGKVSYGVNPVLTLASQEYSMAFRNGDSLYYYVVAALEELRKNEGRPFDVVLTDVWMPEMDGEDLVREIRSDPALKDLKVFAVTADVERQKDYAGMGFTGILMKPITFETLKSALA